MSEEGEWTEDPDNYPDDYLDENFDDGDFADEDLEEGYD